MNTENTQEPIEETDPYCTVAPHDSCDETGCCLNTRCTPEACASDDPLCEPAGEEEGEANSSYEEILAAYNHLLKLVNDYDEKAIIQMFLMTDEGHTSFYNNVSKVLNKACFDDVSAFKWNAARGTMISARECFHGDFNAIGKGIENLLRGMKESDKGNPIDAFLKLLAK